MLQTFSQTGRYDPKKIIYVSEIEKIENNKWTFKVGVEGIATLITEVVPSTRHYDMFYNKVVALQAETESEEEG